MCVCVCLCMHACTSTGSSQHAYTHANTGTLPILIICSFSALTCERQQQTALGGALLTTTNGIYAGILSMFYAFVRIWLLWKIIPAYTHKHKNTQQHQHQQRQQRIRAQHKHTQCTLYACNGKMLSYYNIRVYLDIYIIHVDRLKMFRTSYTRCARRRQSAEQSECRQSPEIIHTFRLE